MRLVPVALFLSALSAPAWSQEVRPDLKLLTARYIAAQQAVYERGAGPAQLHELMSFYAPDYTYYHPQFGAKITGLQNVRRGTGSHLGELKRPSFKILGILVNGDIVSVALRESFDDIESGKRIERDRTTVLTVKDGKIVQRVDI